MAASINGQREYLMVIPLLLFEAGQRNAGRTAPAVLTPEAFH